MHLELSSTSMNVMASKMAVVRLLVYKRTGFGELDCQTSLDSESLVRGAMRKITKPLHLHSSSLARCNSVTNTHTAHTQYHKKERNRSLSSNCNNFSETTSMHELTNQKVRDKQITGNRCLIKVIKLAD